jgi:hypothetical protein
LETLSSRRAQNCPPKIRLSQPSLMSTYTISQTKTSSWSSHATASYPASYFRARRATN